MNIEQELCRLLLNGEPNTKDGERGRGKGFNLSKPNDKLILIEYGDMYNPPELSLDLLVEIKNLFKAKDVKVDTMGWSGCETCDWGSWYGHEINVIEPKVDIAL
jgi:hypothetical protein